MRENPTAMRSKSSIEQALLGLMRHKPYRSISVAAVARAAGLSRQAFYLNFADKDAVLTRVLLRLLEDIMARVQQEGVDSVPALVHTYTGVVEEHAAFFRMLADNGLGGLVCRLFSARLSELPPVLRCQRENGSEQERLYFNAFWVAAFSEVYAVWLSEDMRTPRETLEQILTDIMLGNYFRPQDG